MRELPKKITRKYFNAYRSLYGEQPATTVAPPVEKTAPRPSNAVKPPLEREEQARLCVWLDKSKILYYAVPNGGKRGKIEAYTLRRTGLKAGVPDICVPIASPPPHNYHGLYIELKRVKSGVVSPEQDQWLKALNDNGYLAIVAYGCDNAVEIIKIYLGLL